MEVGLRRGPSDGRRGLPLGVVVLLPVLLAVPRARADPAASWEFQSGRWSSLVSSGFSVTQDGLHIEVPGGDPPLRVSLRGASQGGRRWTARPTPLRPGVCLPESDDTSSPACDARLVREMGPIVEWYEGRPEGLEWGWDLAAPLGPAPEFVLDLVVSGGDVSVQGGSLWIGAGIHALRMDSLRAEDASGRDLPVHWRDSGDGVGVVVEVAGARWPVHVDPLLSMVSPWSVEGGSSNDVLGWAVAGIADVNDDGWDEIAIGTPGIDGAAPGSGGVMLFLGSGAGPGSVPDWTFVGEGAYAELGSSLLGPGDLDGDGHGDLLVGAPGASYEATAVGSVLFFQGGPAGLGSAPWFTWISPQAGDRLGAAMAAVGDVDGDGWEDVALSAPGDEGGRIEVRRGGPGLAEVPWLLWWGAEADSRAGTSLSGAGDTDGDGFDDLWVGIPDSSGVLTPGGGVQLLLGGASGFAEGPSWWSPALTARCGVSIAAAGDLNGDGPGDVLVGCPGWSSTGLGQGALVVLAGGANLSPWVILPGEEDGAALGSAVVLAGDLDGDGVADLAAGAPWQDGVGAQTGAVWAWSGAALPGGLPTAYQGAIAEGRLGQTLAAGIELNQDGLADLLAGAWLDGSLGGGAGSALGILGLDASIDLDSDGACSSLLCPAGLTPGDCDDNDATIGPDEAERCDGVDQDCDGVLPADEIDDDGDGFAPCGGDCADHWPAIHPAAAETCDSIDRDCDGDPTANAPPEPFWPDGDHDAWGDGDAQIVWVCGNLPPGFAARPGDCNDDNAGVRPDAEYEPCDGVDEDCDPGTPEFPDHDGDGTTSCESCVAAPGWARCGDCNDADNLVGPQIAERCGDDIDQDCDGADLSCVEGTPCAEADLLCEGETGCQVGGGAHVGAVFAGFLGLLWGLRSRFRTLVFVALLMPQVGHAVEAEIDSQLFRPTFAPSGFLGAPGADPGLAGSVRAGLFWSAEKAPMRQIVGGATISEIIALRSTFVPGVWWTPKDGLGLGASIPFVVQQVDPAVLPDAKSLGLGDLRLDLLVRVAGTPRLSLGVTGQLLLPTHTREALLGERYPRGAVGVALQSQRGAVEALVASSLELRAPIHTAYDLELGPDWVIQGALRGWILPGRFAVQAEALLRVGLKPPARGVVPGELRTGLRLVAPRGLSVDVGLGVGLGGGYGTPQFRGILGITGLRLPPQKSVPELPPPRIDKPDPEETWEEDGLPEDFVLEEVRIRRRPWKDPPPPKADAPVDAAPRATIDGPEIRLSQPVRFQQGTARILPESLPVLDAVRVLLDEHPGIMHVVITGHASIEGDATLNWALSTHRGEAVFRVLVEQGVHPDRLSWRGMGETVAEDPADGRLVDPRDRRVRFTIVRQADPRTEPAPIWPIVPAPWTVEGGR